MSIETFDTIIVGAGPAGCAAALELTGAGQNVLLLEKLPVPGGLSRTVVSGDNRFDIGPHRYFTKSPEVLALWRNVLGDDLLEVDRLTRIVYGDKLVNYPLSPLNALMGLGPVNSLLAKVSYLNSQLRRRLRRRPAENFEEWVSDRFGQVLYRTFFKTYTEKIWGIPCSRISAEWASQRIQGLSLPKALLNAARRGKSNGEKTLADRFLYPRLGAGELCQRITDRLTDMGADVRLQATVTRVTTGEKTHSVLWCEQDGSERRAQARHLVSSAPVTELICSLAPQPPEAVLEAARALRYRNHICVNLVLPKPVFPDNWIYVHSPEVTLARVANYRSFSSAMSAGDEENPVTAEYFTSTGDAIERMDDDALCDLAVQELKHVGLLSRSEEVTDRFVVRNAKAYPLLEIGCAEKRQIIREFLTDVQRLWSIGRGGLYKYNNMDHAALTGLLAARNVLGERHDIWGINATDEHIEAGVSPSVGGGSPSEAG